MKIMMYNFSRIYVFPCLDVLGVVLQLVEDDAGAGHAGALQQAHQVDDEGTAELLDEAALTPLTLLRDMILRLF